jgi:hypothetical protein
LVKFDTACDIYNVVEYDVSCQVFILTLKGNTSEWFYPWIPRTIISWDVIKKLFFKIYFPRKDPYSLFSRVVEIQMNEEETVKYFTFIFMKVLHEIP